MRDVCAVRSLFSHSYNMAQVCKGHIRCVKKQNVYAKDSLLATAPAMEPGDLDSVSNSVTGSV